MPFYLGLLLPSKATSIAAGIAPYMALELASYDLMPSDVPAFAKGFTAALFATSICYPLDTVRCVWHQPAVYVSCMSAAAIQYHMANPALRDGGVDCKPDDADARFSYRA